MDKLAQDTPAAPALSIPNIMRGESIGHHAEPEAAQPDARSIAFQILSVIGEGGMGVVYLAMQQYPARRVALKVLKGSLAQRNLLHRFEREVEILATLQHPGVARLYSAGTMRDPAGVLVPYMAMEYVSGIPINRFVVEKSLSIRARLSLFLKVCEAVRYVHANGIIHRDLTANNVLVDDAGNPKVLDFGLATFDSWDRSPLLTLAGQPLGTLHYMSPEQAMGRLDRVNQQADVYALGVMLYEIMSEHPPLDLRQMDLGQALRQIQEATPRKLSAHNPSLRGDIEMIVSKAMSKDCDHRYATVADFAEDVRRFLAKEPILARPPSTLYSARKFISRHRVLVTAAALVVASLVTGMTMAMREASRANVEAGRANMETRRANMELARAKVAQGDALLLAERFGEARDAFDSACEQFESAGASPLPAQLGIWELNQSSAQPIRTVLADGRNVSRAAISPDQRLLALGYFGGTVEIREVQTNVVVATFKLGNNINRLCFSSDSSCIGASCSGQYAVWNIAQKQQLRAGNTSDRYSANLAIDGDRLAVATSDGVSIEDLAVPTPTQNFISASTLWIAFTADHRLLAIDQDHQLWRSDTHGVTPSRIGVVPGHKVIPPVFSPDGSLLLVQDGKEFAVLSTESLQELHRITSVTDPRYFGFAGNDRIYIQDGRSGPYTLFDLEGHSKLKFAGIRTSVAAASSGMMLAMDNVDHLVLSSLAESPGRILLASGLGHSNGLDLNRDGSIAALASSDSVVHLFNTASAVETGTLPASAPLEQLEFIDDRTLAVGLSNGTIEFWDVTSGTKIKELNTGNNLRAFAASPQFVISCNDGQKGVSLWRWKSDRWERDDLKCDLEIAQIHLSNDGATALLTANQGGMEVWDIRGTPVRLYQLFPHDKIRDSMLSPDGRLVIADVTGTRIKLVKIPDLADHPIELHSRGVMPVKIAMMRENKIALTEDSNLYLLDSDGSLIRRLSLPGPSLTGLAASQTNDRVLVRNGVGQAWVLNLKPSDAKK